MDNKFWRETDGQRPRPVQARQAGRLAAAAAGRHTTVK